MLKNALTGHHIYKKIWISSVGEMLKTEMEPDNEHDKTAVKVMKDGETVAPINQRIG